MITLPDGYYKTSKREFRIVNGKLDGELKEWWPNGKLWVHCTFKNGLLNGEYKEWSEDGKLIIAFTKTVN